MSARSQSSSASQLDKQRLVAKLTLQQPQSGRLDDLERRNAGVAQARRCGEAIQDRH
jgi:hypothetical protein